MLKECLLLILNELIALLFNTLFKLVGCTIRSCECPHRLSNYLLKSVLRQVLLIAAIIFSCYAVLIKESMIIFI